jgi:hypothetical protein
MESVVGYYKELFQNTPGETGETMKISVTTAGLRADLGLLECEGVLNTS